MDLREKFCSPCVFVFVFLCAHHDLEIVTGDHLLPVLHPAYGRRRVSRHGTLQLDVGGFRGVRVGGIVEELRRNCGRKQTNKEQEIQSLGLI